jgi:hypothetical protein
LTQEQFANATQSEYEGIQCYLCPDGGDCTSAGLLLEDVNALAGWWLDPASTSADDRFYECHDVTFCNGGSASSQCREGRTGPLCALCKEGYQEMADGTCGECNNDETSALYFATVGIIMALLLAGLFAYLLKRDTVLYDELLGFYDRQKRESAKLAAALDVDSNQPVIADTLDSTDIQKEELPANSMDSEITDLEGGDLDYRTTLYVLIKRREVDDRKKNQVRSNKLQYVLDRYRKHQQLKIMIGLYQVLTQITSNMAFPWPTTFKTWMDTVESLISVNPVTLTGAGCIVTVSYFLTWKLYVLLPIFVFIGIGLFFYLPMLYCKRNDDDPNKIKILNFQVVKQISFFFYLVYPTLAANVAKMYSCQRIGNETYLIEDFSQKCSTAKYETYAYGYNLLPFVFYTLGIPAFLGWKLRSYHQSNHLNDVEAWYELGFFYLPYLTKYYYFECLDMLHKLFFSAAVAICPPEAQLQVGMVGGYAYLVLLLVLSPYPNPVDLGLHLTAQIEILLVLLGEHVYYNTNAWENPAVDLLFSVILLVILAFFMVLFLYHLRRKLSRIFCSGKEGLLCFVTHL